MGTGLNVPKGYDVLVAKKISALVGQPFITGLDGAFHSLPLRLPYPNVPGAAGFNFRVTDYWPHAENVNIAADRITPVDVQMIRICHDANIVGTVVNAITQQPIEGAFVSAVANQELFRVTTDSGGAFALR